MQTVSSNKSVSFFILIWFTIITIIAQFIFFIIHYKVSDLIDSLVQSSLKFDLFHPIIFLPLLGFIIIHLCCYGLFIMAVWFISIGISELFKLSRFFSFWLSVLLWLISTTCIFCLNSYFFPDSFFAKLIPTNTFILRLSTSLLFFATCCAYLNFFIYRRHIFIGGFFLIIIGIFISLSFYDRWATRATLSTATILQPNIILIGLDSLRPDFIGYYGNKTVRTPHIDSFLKESVHFTEAYTPLARTFPAWISILTANYPKHNHARTNLGNPDAIHAEETLAKRLHALGYETIYGTDEKRFSNITERYGFDRLIGPSMGVNDFILGGLNDFPLTNLFINSSLGRFLFPFNYANRAAAITYEPDKFIQLVKLGLAHRSSKPLFLSIHLCVSHWPFTWARDQQPVNSTLPQRYASSINALDKQLGMLLDVLQKNGLLQQSVVVLLSDHGTTVGLPNDRIIAEKNYVGDPQKIKWLSIFKLSSAADISFDFKRDYTINTSYGQGNDVLSLKQYHVLLAFRGYGIDLPPQYIDTRASLMDIAPTILDFLHQRTLKKSDGISLKPFMKNQANYSAFSSARVLFLETGYSLAEIETKNIFIEQVIKHSIGAYKINPATGFLSIKPESEKSINDSKQRAVLMGEWLLARYPERTRSQLALSSLKQLTLKTTTQPLFFVIANLKTGKWDIGLDSALAKQAPIKKLLSELYGFYGDEI